MTLRQQQRNTALVFEVLKAAGITKNEAAAVLGRPWQTLYCWRRRHISRYGRCLEPKPIWGEIHKAGRAISRARKLMEAAQ